MYTDSYFIKIFKVVIVLVAIVCTINLLSGKYSIFNYLKQKSLINTLAKKQNKKAKEKQRLLNEVNLLGDTSVINIDIAEKETVKKLNKIPSNYFIIIQWIKEHFLHNSHHQNLKVPYRRHHNIRHLLHLHQHIQHHHQLFLHFLRFLALMQLLRHLL